MAQITLTTWVNRFLQKLPFVAGTQTVDAQQAEARALLNAASHTETVAALAAKQPLDSDLTAYADAATPAARRALFGAAPLESANFSGTNTVPTPAAGDESAQIANTSWVQNEMAKRPRVYDGDLVDVVYQVFGSFFTGLEGEDPASVFPLMIYGGEDASNYYWSDDGSLTGDNQLLTVSKADANNITLTSGGGTSTWDSTDGGATFNGVFPATTGIEAGAERTIRDGEFVGHIVRDNVNNVWKIWKGETWDELAITAP